MHTIAYKIVAGWHIINLPGDWITDIHTMHYVGLAQARPNYSVVVASMRGLRRGRPTMNMFDSTSNIIYSPKQPLFIRGEGVLAQAYSTTYKN